MRDSSLSFCGQARGRDVNRFFKERAIQWVGLIKQGQHFQLTMREKPFQGHLEAWDEVFDQKHGFVFGIALVQQQAFEALKSRRKFPWSIRAYHAATP